MDFEFSEEQRLLRESVAQFVAQDYPFSRRRELAASEEGFGRDVWARFADLGWLALPFPEEAGGFGATPVETMILMEAIGRGLMVEPFLSTVVLGGGSLRLGGSPSQRAEALPPLIEGKILLAFAFAEPQSRFHLADVETRAERNGAGHRLTGRKIVVLHGGTADKLVVSARTGGSARDEAGISLFLIDRASPGVELRAYPTIDGLRAAEITLEGVEAGPESLLGELGGALPLIEAVVDNGIAAVCAEALGAMEVLYETTLEYLRTRRQFGRPIGSFQVLQHRMVDMYMELEQARSMTYMVTLRLEDPDPAERRRAAAAAQVPVGESGRVVGRQAVQLHGGMGMVDEHLVSHYFKRLTVIDTQFGNVDHHLERMAAL